MWTEVISSSTIPLPSAVLSSSIEAKKKLNKGSEIVSFSMSNVVSSIKNVVESSTIQSNIGSPSIEVNKKLRERSAMLSFSMKDAVESARNLLLRNRSTSISDDDHIESSGCSEINPVHVTGSIEDGTQANEKGQQDNDTQEEQNLPLVSLPTSEPDSISFHAKDEEELVVVKKHVEEREVSDLAEPVQSPPTKITANTDTAENVDKIGIIPSALNSMCSEISSMHVTSKDGEQVKNKDQQTNGEEQNLPLVSVLALESESESSSAKEVEDLVIIEKDLKEVCLDAHKHAQPQSSSIITTLAENADTAVETGTSASNNQVTLSPACISETKVVVVEAIDSTPIASLSADTTNESESKEDKPILRVVEISFPPIDNESASKTESELINEWGDCDKPLQPSLNKQDKKSSLLRKTSVAIGGGATVVIGLIMIPLPTPCGCVVTAGGMSILATEFPLAAQILGKTCDKFVEVIEKNITTEEGEEDNEQKEQAAAAEEFVVIGYSPKSYSTRFKSAQRTMGRQVSWIGRKAIPVIQSIGTNKKNEDDETGAVLVSNIDENEEKPFEPNEKEVAVANSNPNGALNQDGPTIWIIQICKAEKSTSVGIILKREDDHVHGTKKESGYVVQGGVAVSSILENSQFLETNIQIGDIILSVNNIDCRSKSAIDTAKIISESVGIVTIVYTRYGAFEKSFLTSCTEPTKSMAQDNPTSINEEEEPDDEEIVLVDVSDTTESKNVSTADLNESNGTAIASTESEEDEEVDKFWTAQVYKPMTSTRVGLVVLRENNEGPVLVDQISDTSLFLSSSNIKTTQKDNSIQVGDIVLSVNNIDCRGKSAVDTAKIMSAAVGAVSIVYTHKEEFEKYFSAHYEQEPKRRSFYDTMRSWL